MFLVPRAKLGLCYDWVCLCDRAWSKTIDRCSNVLPDGKECRRRREDIGNRSLTRCPCVLRHNRHYGVSCAVGLGGAGVPFSGGDGALTDSYDKKKKQDVVHTAWQVHNELLYLKWAKRFAYAVFPQQPVATAVTESSSDDEVESKAPLGAPSTPFVFDATSKPESKPESNRVDSPKPKPKMISNQERWNEEWLFSNHKPSAVDKSTPRVGMAHPRPITSFGPNSGGAKSLAALESTRGAKLPIQPIHKAILPFLNQPKYLNRFKCHDGQPLLAYVIGKQDWETVEVLLQHCPKFMFMPHNMLLFQTKAILPRTREISRQLVLGCFPKPIYTYPRERTFNSSVERVMPHEHAMLAMEDQWSKDIKRLLVVQGRRCKTSGWFRMTNALFVMVFKCLWNKELDIPLMTQRNTHIVPSLTTSKTIAQFRLKKQASVEAAESSDDIPCDYPRCGKRIPFAQYDEHRNQHVHVNEWINKATSGDDVVVCPNYACKQRVPVANYEAHAIMHTPKYDARYPKKPSGFAQDKSMYASLYPNGDVICEYPSCNQRIPLDNYEEHRRIHSANDGFDMLERFQKKHIDASSTSSSSPGSTTIKFSGGSGGSAASGETKAPMSPTSQMSPKVTTPKVSTSKISEGKAAESCVQTGDAKMWFLGPVLHKDNDEPAYVHKNGTRIWYRNGKRHRANNMPAEILPDGSKFWYVDGKRHRGDDFPALVESSGDKEWWVNGQLHRDHDLPAIIRADGTQLWYKRNLLHRDGDLPAMIQADGSKRWFVDGLAHRDGDQPAHVLADGSRRWYQKGDLHRDGDMPAVVDEEGTRFWYQNGFLHREGGRPAVVSATGREEFFVKGVRKSDYNL